VGYAVTVLPRIVAVLCLTALGVAVAAPAPATSADETIEVNESLAVRVSVPEKWTLSRTTGGGYPAVNLQSEDRAVSILVSLFPDENGLMTDEEMQLIMMGDMIAPYLPTSVEKGAQMHQLNPRRGSGIYCVFTDAKLVGVEQLPPNEYRHATTGLMIANGWFATFTVFSQDTRSSSYQEALEVLRTRLHGGVAGGGKPKRNPNAF